MRNVRIAVIGDVHLVADADPYKALHHRRAFFKSCWPSFQRLVAKVNEASPDLTILLGDLVDWFSPENVAFGLDLVSALDHPWEMTPGNHDVAAPAGGHDQEDYSNKVASREHLAYWSTQGVDLSTRRIDLGVTSLVLLDSALSDLDPNDEAKFDEVFERPPDLLFTHVPIDTPETRDYILSVDANRSMAKYVLSGAADFYTRFVKDRIPHVFTGHLHFPGDLTVDHTRFHLRNMGISMTDPHRKQNAIASAAVIDVAGGTFRFGDLLLA